MVENIKITRKRMSEAKGTIKQEAPCDLRVYLKSLRGILPSML